MKGRISPFLVLVVVAFALVGLVSFQSLKDRKNTSALLEQSQSDLRKTENRLKENVKAVQSKDESLKVVEEERDYFKRKLSELERQAQSTQEELRSTLSKKEKELHDISKNHREALEEVEQLKGLLDQKENEIVQVRTQLQEYAFAKARESGEQLNKGNAEHQNKDGEDTESVEGKPEVEEIKLADEAGIGDRSKVQDEEELQLRKESESLVVEKEMDERSKPSTVINEEKSGERLYNVNRESTQEVQIVEKQQETQETAEQEDVDTVVKDEINNSHEDEETIEQELADPREETEERETLETGKTSQEEEERRELETDLMSDLRSDHDEEGMQQIESRLD